MRFIFKEQNIFIHFQFICNRYYEYLRMLNIMKKILYSTYCSLFNPEFFYYDSRQ